MDEQKILEYPLQTLEADGVVIRALETESSLVPDDKHATSRLFNVLTDIQFHTHPHHGWPKSLTDVIALGEKAIPWIQHQVCTLVAKPIVEVDAVHVQADSILRVQRNLYKQQQIPKLLYFTIALCYIKSPRIAPTLLTVLEKNIQMWLWPDLLDNKVAFFDPFERIYIGIARALFWVKAEETLARLKDFLQQAMSLQNSMLNSLPYAIRAIGFLGTEAEIIIVKQFLEFSSPGFDVSESKVRLEAKHALYSLQHPEEQEERANSPSDAWGI